MIAVDCAGQGAENKVSVFSVQEVSLQELMMQSQASKLGPPSLLYNGYRVFPGGKVRPGRAADHSPPSSAAVMEE